MSVCHRPVDSLDPRCLSDKASKDSFLMLPGFQKKRSSAYLFQTPTLGADKSHAVAVVDVGGDGSHAVPGLGVESVTSYQLRATEGLIDIQTAERVIDGHRLRHKRGNGGEEERKKSLRSHRGMSDMLEPGTECCFCFQCFQ